MRTQPVARSSRAPSPATDLLICFSHLRWNFVYQRPQHLLSRAARSMSVLYFEEPMFDDSVDPGGALRVQRQACGVVVVVPVLRRDCHGPAQTEVIRHLLDELLAERRAQRLITWYYTPMALAFSAHLQPSVCIYDCMDELSAFRFAPQVLSTLEQDLLSLADVVFTGGHSLYLAKRNLHSNCHEFPSAVDVAHFRRAREACIDPDDQKDIGHPRVGFFGVIDERMNLDLVAELAVRRQDLNFILIGPTAKVEPSALPQAGNLFWLGPRDYLRLPEYLSGWDAAFMPFALNDSTRYISPTKTPEFLAAGVPVCSTPIADVVEPYGIAGLVAIAETAAEFSVQLDGLMAERTRTWLHDVDRHLAGISWDVTWARMFELIERELETTAPSNSETAEIEHV